MKKIFITGIGTDVGKTIASAIITESLQADYWKPIQAGELENSDIHKVQGLVSNSKSIFHKNSYAFTHAESPHSAAKKENIKIELDNIITPNTSNNLVIEGAGGILVPLNNKNLIIDIIKPNYKVIIVSQNYLGSINHTLLTIEALKNRNLNIAGIIFNGNENKETESIINLIGNIAVIGRINQESNITKKVIKKYASLFYEKLIKI